MFVATFSVGLPPVHCMYVLIIVLSCAVFVVAAYSAGLPPVHVRVQSWIATVCMTNLMVLVTC